jgi:hypothetical protein
MLWRTLRPRSARFGLAGFGLASSGCAGSGLARLGLAGFLVLAAVACGSQQPGVFHPDGAAVAATNPSATAQVSGPVPFPGQLTFEFDPLPSTALAARIVTTDRQFILAYYYAIYTRGKSDRFASYIGDNNVLLNVQGNIEQQVSEDRGYTGVTRYFDTSVASVPGYGGDQVVTYCVDESQLEHTNINTGRVVPKGYPPDHQYYLESDMFSRAAHGAWKLVGTQVTYYPNGQARECRS